MKPNYKLYIVIIIISSLVFAAFAVFFALIAANIIETANNDFYEDLSSWGIFIGLIPLLFASIFLHLKRKVYKRACAVLQRYKNMGEGVYVQGYYGNKKADKNDRMHNTVSTLGALSFAAAFGVGAYTIKNSRIKSEFFIVNGEMYVNGIADDGFGDVYMPVDEMHTVYKGWYARHEIAVNKKSVTVTGADGDSFIYLDLKTCSTDRNGLLTALENVFGVPYNGASQITKDNSHSPFEEL